jgi:crotonobetainyl-CoA:carnitine CoA-transferase CaiB-like acyl-CoA transferase
VSGAADDPPQRIGMPVADLTTPLFAVIGVLSALHMAKTTGVGQHVDVSMLGAVTSLMAGEAFDALEELGVPLRTGQTVPRLAPFGIYPAQGGHISICAPTDAFVAQLFRCMERPDLASDARFATRNQRVRHASELDQMVAAWTGAHERSELLAKLAASGVPAEPVRTPHEAVRDERVLARGECVRLEHPTYGATAEVIGMGLPIRFSQASAGFDQPAPAQGEHNLQVYQTLLGYSDEKLADLRRRRVI